MKHTFLVAPSLPAPPPLLIFDLPISNTRSFSHHSNLRCLFELKPSPLNSCSFQMKFKPSRSLFRIRSFKSSALVSDDKTAAYQSQESEVLSEPKSELNVEVRSPVAPAIVPPPKLSLSDQAFFLLAFIACTTSAAFVGLVAVAVPTLFAMGRAAVSLSKLADTAREELPSTMAAIRLSGMEISDLTLELSDLSREIADGVNKSAQAVHAAEAGIKKFGSLARQRTMSMIEERANLPTISLQPVVAGAAKKTSHAVGHATRTFMKIISRGELTSNNDNGNGLDRLEV